MHCLGRRGLHAVPSRSAERSAHLCSSAAAAPAAGAQGADVRTNSTNSTALQVRRQQHRLQEMLSDLSSQQTEPPRPRPPGPGHSSKKAKAAGFGGPNGSTATKQQQHRLQIRSQDTCPCKSGLLYQDCCQPFLSGQVHPRSAPELARARITASLAGDVPFLVSTTHPDSSLALGGNRDLTSRSRREAAVLRDSKVAVVGMAHCQGDAPDTWLVLTILQATAGEAAGTKAPLMQVMAKRGSRGSSQQPEPGSRSNSSSSGSGGNADDWLYLAQANSLPQHEDAEVLWQLLQLHVPQLLHGDDADGTTGGVVSRDVYFVWTAPALNLPTAPEAAARTAAAAAGGGGGGTPHSSSSSSSSQPGWYLDMLQPTVEVLGGGGGSGRPNSRQQAAAAGGVSGVHGVSGRRPAGVISMDAVKAARS